MAPFAGPIEFVANPLTVTTLSRASRGLLIPNDLTRYHHSVSLFGITVR